MASSGRPALWAIFSKCKCFLQGLPAENFKGLGLLAKRALKQLLRV